jgi:TonB-linked SusC/RagA family outer membrane protein
VLRTLFCAAAALLVIAPAASAQREVSGRVTILGSGEPVADASVGVVGIPVGARTNARGEYRLRVPDGEVTLATRMIGYKRQTARVAANQATVNFELEKDVLQLEAITVTGAATTVERRNATSSVAQVNSDQLTRVPAVSIENALQGKILGASINMNNGAPGGGGQIQIRGASSLIGKIDPLYVIDGVIVSNDVRSNGQRFITNSLNSGEENGTNRLADINPADIETIEVLKGSVASAIYGSQATNGVVVITTKRGRSGSPRFQLTQRVGTYRLMRDRGMRHFANVNTVLTSATVACATPTTPTDQCGNPAGAAAARAVCTATSCPYYDYFKMLYGRTDPSWETSASMSGGVETTKYYVSLDDREEAGIATNTGARRQSVRASVDQALGSKISVNIASNIMRSFSQRGISNNDNTNSSPLYGFAYTPNVLDLSKQDAQGNYPINPFGGSPLNISNPFQTFDIMRNNEDVYRVITNGTVNFQAWASARNDVRLTVVSGADRYSSQNFELAPPSLQFEQPGTNEGTFPGASIQGNGSTQLVNTNLTAVWTFTPNRGWFAATTSAGAQYADRQISDYTIVAQGLTPSVVAATGAVHTTTFDSLVAQRNQAFYAQEDFLTFGEKVLLSAAVRTERSSVNGDSKKYYTFPRFGASYRIVRPFRGIGEIKLRGTVGQSGNQPNYGERFLTLTNGGQIGGQTGLIQALSIGNPNVRPERQTETEVGLDGSFLDDRAQLEVTWFNRDITDLLVRPLLAPSSGVNQEVINGGSMRTHGTEVGVTIAPIESRTNGLTWTSRTTYQQNSAKILRFAPGVLPFTIGAAGGFGTAYGRLKFSPGNSVSAIYGNKPLADGTIARDVVVGDANPIFTMAFSNDFTWSNLRLGTVVDWRKGGTVSNLTMNLQDEGNTTWDYDKPSPNPAVGATLGAWRYNTWGGGANTSIYLADGSFVKIREVTLSYDVPSQRLASLQQFGVRTSSLSVSGRNLFIISGYHGFDPEVNNGGNVVARFVDLAPYPPSRSFFFTVNLGF